MAVRQYIALAALAAQALGAPPLQIPLQATQGQVEDTSSLPELAQKRRPLHGRFLQITDFHPDPFYEVYSSTAKDDACHSGRGSAGIYGAETSDCDSPISLVNKTMEWIGKEFRDNVDFVIWTGDSARHDNDDDIPRSEEQVLDLNRLMVRKMNEAFGKRDGDEPTDNPNNDFVVPIIPNLGNNDILPHNIMHPGPNKWTRSYSREWKQFIPEEQRHQFEQGGWFYVEVIPHRLAVFSLNTLYFFSKNAAADGCAQPSEPGFQQMEWLRIQLQFMRDRGMKAIIIGHVPPTRQESKTSWEETCWQKYTLWLRQYRDVVVSSHYGHFNYDHLILQDFEDLRKGTRKGKMPDYDLSNEVKKKDADDDDDDDFNTAVSSNYFIELREGWSELPEPPETLSHAAIDSATPCDSSDWWCQSLRFAADVLMGSKKKDKKHEKEFFEKIGGRYAERYAASFISASVVPNLFPVVRVFEYNITGLTHDSRTQLPVPPQSPSPREDKVKALKKKYKFDLPEAPSKSAPPGPAYSPQTLSLLTFKQYLANLTYINNDFVSKSEESLVANDTLDILKWNEGKHKGKKPHDRDYKPKPNKFKFELHYDSRDDDVYRMKDLTMPSIVDLARRIGEYVPVDDFDVVGGSNSESNQFDEDVDVQKKSKKDKKKKKEKKKEKQRERNKPWLTFVQRAFVETLDPDELRDEFGS